MDNIKRKIYVAAFILACIDATGRIISSMSMRK